MQPGLLAGLLPPVQTAPTACAPEDAACSHVCPVAGFSAEQPWAAVVVFTSLCLRFPGCLESLLEGRNVKNPLL